MDIMTYGLVFLGWVVGGTIGGSTGMGAVMSAMPFLTWVVVYGPALSIENILKCSDALVYPASGLPPPPLWFVRAPAPLSLQRCLFTRDDLRVCGSRSDLFSHVFFWHLVEFLMSRAVRCPVFQHGKRRTSRSICQRYRCLVDSSTRFYLL